MKKEITVESMRCPITKKLMLDPVIASDGQTYERKAIQEVLDSDHVSPVNGQPLTRELKPNTWLQEAIAKKIAIDLALELKELSQKNPEMSEALKKIEDYPPKVMTQEMLTQLTDGSRSV